MSAKLTALTDLSAPALTDEMYIVRPSLGLAGSRSITLANLQTFLFAAVAIAFPTITTTIGNAGAGLDPLHSFSLPAGSLATNGDYLHVRYGGFFNTGNANTKRVQVSADSQVAFNSGARVFDIGLARGWRIELDYIRIADTALRVSGFAALGNALTSAGAFDGGNSRFYYQALQPTDLTVSDLDTNAITLLVEGESGGAADNDVVQTFSAFELTQF